MTPIINIHTNNTCDLIIEDVTQYLVSQAIINNDFRSEDVSSIIIVQHHKIQSEPVIKNTLISNKKINKIHIDFDGYFTIQYIILPNKNWFINASNSEKNQYKFIYYTDGSNVYKYDTETKVEVTVPINLLSEYDNPKECTLYKVSKDYVSICYLQRCYLNVCQQIFNSRGLTTCWKNNNIDSELVYKRDLLWMAINVIKYLTSLHKENCRPTLTEVERIIEVINGCNGLCSKEQLGHSGCGCSK